jgi:hypothetical protein
VWIRSSEPTLVHRIPIEDVAVDIHRPRRIVEPLDDQLADAVLDGELLRDLFGGLGLPVQHVEELVPGLLALVERRQRRERLGIRGVLIQHRPPRLDRPLSVLELVAPQSGELHQDAASLGPVELDLGLASQRPGELG